MWSPDGSRIAFFEVWKGNITIDPLSGDVIYVSAGPVDNHIDLLALARQ